METKARRNDPIKVKVVGRRRPPQEMSPLEFHQRAWRLQRQADRLNPFPKPRGFVFRAKSWRAYEAWRQKQDNPRLW